jgi:hypothetical protein
VTRLTESIDAEQEARALLATACGFAYADASADTFSSDVGGLQDVTVTDGAHCRRLVFGCFRAWLARRAWNRRVALVQLWAQVWAAAASDWLW